MKIEVHMNSVGKGRVKSSLSKLHIDACAFFAGFCQQIETEESHLAWPQPRWRLSASYALSSVIQACSALEASINEFYQKAIDRDKKNLPTLSNEQFLILDKLWHEEKKYSTLKKYQVALTAAGKEPMHEGAEPFQSAKLLIDLRNALIHFKPEWDNETGPHDKLESKLKKHFNPNQLIEMAEGTMTWFPYRCLGAGCAEWSLATAKEFNDNFCAILGIKTKF